MMKTALSILKNKRSFEAEKDLMSIKDIFEFNFFLINSNEKFYLIKIFF